MKKLFVIVVFVSLSCFAREGFAQSSSPDNATKQQAALTELPDTILNSELHLLGGKTLRLSEFDGKVIIINLFATWCGPCRFESPDLAKLHREFSERGLVVIELSTEDPVNSKESVREWVRKYRLPYKVGWATRDVAITLMQERQSIPQAFLIARDGRILKRFIGYNPKTTYSQMKQAVEDALK